MKKLTKINYNITDGSSFSGFYLKVSLDRLIKLFGQPTIIGSGDNKVQLEWVFYETNHKNLDPNSPGEIETIHKCITIYDWKKDQPIHQIKEWNVGRKAITKEEIQYFLEEMGIDAIDEMEFSN